MPRHCYLVSQWQLEKRVAFTRLLDRLDWLLELRNNPKRKKKIKGFDELDLEDAIEQTADAIIRKSETEHITLAQAIAMTQSIFEFFNEYGFESKSDPPLPPDNESSWKVCPECGNPTYFRITKANYRCTKGHVTERVDMPGDELFTG